jgi:probable HAF family extracellular repeat protein
MLDLGTLGGSESRATAINDAGQVVGVSSLPGDRVRRAFLWSEGQMQPLPTLGGAESYATAIDAAGHVLGWANTPGGAFHAFCYRPGEMADLGALGDGAGMALGSDEAGEVLLLVSDGWGTQACLQTEGGRIDLGTLGGSYTIATAINAAGQVVGGSDTVANAARHAFRWSRGGMEDLGALGHRDSLASGLNGAGEVVGASYTDSDRIRHAFVYRAGQGMLDLNRRIDPAQGWKLVEAEGINAAGQIVGWGYHRGQVRAFRLRPAGGVPAR